VKKIINRKIEKKRVLLLLMRNNPFQGKDSGWLEIAGCHDASGVGKALVTRSEAKGAVQEGKSVVACASETYRGSVERKKKRENSRRRERK